MPHRRGRPNGYSARRGVRIIHGPGRRLAGVSNRGRALQRGPGRATSASPDGGPTSGDATSLFGELFTPDRHAAGGLGRVLRRRRGLAAGRGAGTPGLRLPRLSPTTATPRLRRLSAHGCSAGGRCFSATRPSALVSRRGDTGPSLCVGWTRTLRAPKPADTHRPSSIRIYTYVCIHENTCIYVYIYMHMYIHVCTCISMHIQVCTCIDMYTHMYVHVYTYIYMYKSACSPLGAACASVVGTLNCCLAKGGWKAARQTYRQETVVMCIFARRTPACTALRPMHSSARQGVTPARKRGFDRQACQPHESACRMPSRPRNVGRRTKP